MKRRRRTGFVPAPSRRRQASALTAMTLVAMLTTIGALPAQAAYLDSDGVAVVAATASVRLPAAGPEQSITVTAQPPVAVEIDTFTATEIVVPPPVVVAPAAAQASAVAAAPSGSGVRWPFPGVTRISSDYGPRSAPCSGCSTFHDGLDMNPGVGTPIGSIADGVVSSVTAFDDGGLGVHVLVDHVVDGQRIVSTYGHMLEGSVVVSVGESVSAGQQLGSVGSTGQSTGPHMHLELHLDGVTAIDPYGWLTEHAGPM
jgi:murein DD-endopeptidase MepM/ murein hydrolase activator NlpD